MGSGSLTTIAIVVAISDQTIKRRNPSILVIPSIRVKLHQVVGLDRAEGSSLGHILLEALGHHHLFKEHLLLLGLRELFREMVFLH